MIPDDRMTRAEELSALLDWNGETYHREVAAKDVLASAEATEERKAEAIKELLACQVERERWSRVAAHGALADWLTVIPRRAARAGVLS